MNSILCSQHADKVTEALFPDEVVVCGANPLLLPYVDPGLPLARALRRALLGYTNEPPKAVYLRNHGLVALGQSMTEVLQITHMAVKAAAILAGALAAGGAVFLTSQEVDTIDRRPDEHYRRVTLGGHLIGNPQAGHAMRRQPPPGRA